MRLKNLLAISAFSILTTSGLVVAQGAPDVSVSEMDIKQIDAASFSDPEMMAKTVAKVPGALDLYRTYVANGYLPAHAAMLTNWHVYQALILIEPSLEPDDALSAQMTALYDAYQPKK